jgi:hypothetical protein
MGDLAQQFGASMRFHAALPMPAIETDKGVVDMIGLGGWYSTVSMALNVDRYPVATAELKPLANPLP